jgi:hypothetical protein
MWKTFRTFRFLGSVGAVAYLVLSNFSGGSVVVAVIAGATWLVQQCRAYRPGGQVAHDYGNRKDTAGALSGTRIDSNMYQCTKIATRFLPPSACFTGGCFCAGHAKEENQWGHAD